ncbi:lyase family protein [Leifsonia sp. fls2-241-R2A-40a]|uniref:lyase family protein n=1 Tax=Leifsonia sp. fls2-241-R2A-40a TaxID=3040290 RepID=UPI0025514D96|nr:lyase family protein [Leifsonia sp. fls2-241-R2A-40a]
MADAFDWGLLEPAGEAASAVSDDRILRAMVEVERAHLAAWSGLLGVETTSSLDSGLLDRDALLRESRRAGVPIVGLVQALREQGGTLVHQGMTSQDVMDSALMLVSRDALAASRAALVAAGRRFSTLAREHRGTPFAVRTLTQEAETTTLGTVFGGWLDVLSSTLELLDTASFPLQLGGAVGDGDAFARLSGDPDAVVGLRRRLADALGLADPGRAWHTDRSAVLAVARAALSVCAAGGRIGRDLGLLARDEVVTPLHGGGSSAMPHKSNPVDAVLLVANGLRASGPAAVLQATALSYDARPAGEWHAEWQPWRESLRLAVESAGLLAHAAEDLVVQVRRTATDPASSPRGGAAVDSAVARFERAAGEGVR